MPEEIGRNRGGGVSRALEGEGSPLRLIRLGRTDSTNRYAERLIAGGELDGAAMIVADVQTAGEGRRGAAAWSSPAGGLWATVAWPLEGGDAGAAGEPVLDGLGLRLGLACLRTVRSVAPAARLKWPNDVLVGGRKVCGCMARWLAGPGRRGRGGPAGRGWLLAAAGINANNELDPALGDRAGSLAALTGRAVDLDALRLRLASEFRWALSTHGLTPALVGEAEDALRGVGEPIRLRDQGELVSGTLLGLSAQGSPRVRTLAGDVIEAGPGAESVHDD